MTLTNNGNIIANVYPENIQDIDDIKDIVEDIVRDMEYKSIAVLLTEEESCTVFGSLYNRNQYRTTIETETSSGKAYKISLTVSSYRYVYPMEKGFDMTFWKQK